MKTVRTSFLLITTFVLISNQGAFSMGDLFKREAVENKPGQELSVKTVSGKIAFQSNRDGTLGEVWVLKNGEIRKIASDNKTTSNLPKGFPAALGEAFAGLGHPQWSPDGTRILCSSERGFLIFNQQGNLLETIKLSGPPHAAKWSPDGAAIYFTKSDRLPKGGGSYNIYRFNFSDRSEKKITSLSPWPGVRPIYFFSVSPDNKKIAMQMEGDKVEDGISIWLINTDGNDMKLLVKYAGEPAWSPDSKNIVYVSRNLPSGERASEYLEVFIYNVETGGTTRVTYNQWEEHCPVFSPDGKQIAYKSARHLERVHGAELFVINVDGTGEARLTPPQPNPKYPNDPVRGWSTDQYPDWHA